MPVPGARTQAAPPVVSPMFRWPRQARGQREGDAGFAVLMLTRMAVLMPWSVLWGAGSLRVTMLFGMLFALG